nr:hypothetical protein [uncultured Solibaculum sp.]
MRQLFKQTLILCMAAALCLVVLSGCKKEETSASSSPVSSQSQAESSSAGSSAFSSLPGSSSSASSQAPMSSQAESSMAQSSSNQAASSSSSNPSSPSQSQPSEEQPSTSTQGTEIPYDYQLLRDFSGFINLTTQAISGESFEYESVSDQQLAAAGVMLCKDMGDVQESQKIEKSRFEKEIQQYFGRTIQNPQSLSGNGFQYKDGYYYWSGLGLDDYEFEAQKAYDLGDNYIRVEGQTTLYDMDENPVRTQNAVYVLHRVPSSYYGYYLIAQSYK